MTKLMNHKQKVIAAFIVIYFVWGSTYLAIRYSLESMPPFLVGGIRFFTAGSILLVWNYFRSAVRPSLRDWLVGGSTGLLMFTLDNGLINWSQQFIPSSLAAIVISSIPIWMILIHWMQSRKNKPSRLTVIGITIGLIGLFLLSGIDDKILINSNEFGGSVVLGVVLLTFASITWCLASLYMKNYNTKISLLNIAGIQTFIGGIGLLIISVTSGEILKFSLNELTFKGVLSISYLITFGTLLAYSSYIWLMKVSTPAKVSTYAYFNPIVAILLGGILAGEIITPEVIVGAILIIGSIILINKPWIQFRKTKGDSVETKFERKNAA